MGKTFTDYQSENNLKSEVDREINRIDNRITGWLRFMYSVEKSAAQKLIDEYKKVGLKYQANAQQ